MDKLESMRAFVEVVNHSGFAAAGRQMGLSRSVVNNLVAQLEADLDVQLLQRTTRRVSPTDTGRAYYERCVDILAEVSAAEQSIAQLQVEPKGTLRINAPMSFGTMHLAKAIAHFMHQYPDIQVQLTLNDRFIDLIEEGFDITLRIAEIKKEDELNDSCDRPYPPSHLRRPQLFRSAWNAKRACRTAQPRLLKVRTFGHKQLLAANRSKRQTNQCSTALQGLFQ